MAVGKKLEEQRRLARNEQPHLVLARREVRYRSIHAYLDPLILAHVLVKRPPGKDRIDKRRT